MWYMVFGNDLFTVIASSLAPSMLFFNWTIDHCSSGRPSAANFWFLTAIEVHCFYSWLGKKFGLGLFPAKLEFLIDHLKLVSSIYLNFCACGNDLKLSLAKKVKILICSFHEFWNFAKNTQFSKCNRSQSTQPIFKFKGAMDCQDPNGWFEALKPK